MSRAPDVWTIGHSSVPLARFLELADSQGIQVVADVRSSPFSRFAPHFSRPALESTLLEHGLHYAFLGRELGGRPEDPACYDDEGHALYWKMARTPIFEEGLARLGIWARRYRVALLCSEEDPAECHRHLLVARVLQERGIEVRHVRGTGAVETDAETRGRSRPRRQTSILDAREEPTWRSPQSVLRRNPPKSSSSG
ncbi:MAG: hypothetical protein QOE90_2268 [Thermoplasmata archaeon]|jgi:uncharacterized protein (DUF488 family)|nr:hypothetical protein [Thermoplasmata archaeon]